MTSRERMLRALANEKPDRLPCQVHGWMDYYLETYLGGCDWFEAYARFDMDYAIYVSPEYTYDERDLANWRIERTRPVRDDDGNETWRETIVTPGGSLHQAFGRNAFTQWNTEHLLKCERDEELWKKYYPVPVGADLAPVREAHDRVGDRGIVRSHPYYPGQGSPWQALCILTGTEEAIFLAMDEPERTHDLLESIYRKAARAHALWEGTPADMVETDGGAGSSTVISPDLFRTFCLPYNQRQNALFRALGVKTVCHLCGGIMPMLDLVVESGADGLETMTPPNMGGDCDLAEASRRVGGKLFFIGGFDQNAGFEKGTPEKVRELVFACFEATRDHGGHILAPSDHFFFGDPANLQAFADACRECVY
ncbi:uroporphyrinogen decarboxylase family protein [Kiritimatiella glycovorans]|uniref:Uroporphyrinogen-III decarboxylase-like protein n=1 Tax=Kiritimatiella glycovorans TaxID=1307763 RepID=A0A0G3EHJ1_9BACT|nr:uroporphyrinogen decarboxylase family protein [Kiritimatiella glycovorans]AKJ63654.1 Uroporphyrinogen-III decarboxylase-like protein [Kiritimatiella glycovorans]